MLTFPSCARLSTAGLSYCLKGGRIDVLNMLGILKLGFAEMTDI